MKAVIAIDSLKGSLTSMEAGEAAAEGIRKVYPDAEILVRPVADGGEGTVDAFVKAVNGEKQKVYVTGPLGKRVQCEYGIIEHTRTAIIEMANAAGLPLVPQNERNPLNTTTYGVGEVICNAIEKGCRRFIIGIGGSATNDGGVGMLQALGYKFLNDKGNQISYGAKGLKELVDIDDSNVIPELKECMFYIACDVTNPLCGENGCSAVYGPQKGASAEMVQMMDQWLKNYADLSEKKYKRANPDHPGAGAAGGLGFAFLTYTNSELSSGIELILKEIALEKDIIGADVVITGEGRLDGQTSMGKTPSGVAALAKRFDIPVIAFSGSVTKEATECNKNGIDAFFPILRSVITLEEAMSFQTAKENLTDTVEQVFRFWKICHKK